MTAGPVSAASFAAVCALTPAGPARFTGSIDPVWTVGPKVHGGTLQAGCAAAARAWLTRQLPAAAALQPLAISTNFLGAPEPREVTYAVTIRKTGRQICLVDVELSQDGRTCVLATVTLGRLGEQAPAYQAPHPAMPVAPPAEATERMAEAAPGSVVHFAAELDIRLERTSAAFCTGARSEPVVRLWARPSPADAADPDVALLFASMLADVSPPAVFNLGYAGWAPTVQLTTYLRRRPVPGWFRVISSVIAVTGGTFDEDHLVLDASGALVSQSRQLGLLPKS
ncbi:thioesterase family protein [Skermania piniformis]|uniref:Thioesterase family protein n=1 Tax=Skermania pinensis TaxID=39122 RepID=A0ABX8S948_9ACTN|nr:thioesterase family protein [Skermania piniformis]QXQ14380.1 thioesterase family protein [Skermania piniformis]